MERLSLADRAGWTLEWDTGAAFSVTNHQDRYKGREQSYIKHFFLTKYLEMAAFKTFQGSSPTFNFVDAFAGPWRVADDSDYSDASFDQALNTLESVRVYLARRGRSGLKVRFCFCERVLRSAEKLRRYAEKKRAFEIHVFPGTFEDNLHNVAAACKDGFTFTFIDPTGWNIDSRPVLEFLSQRHGEVLFNFMAENINRHAGYEGVSRSVGRFLAAPDWKDEFDALPKDWSNERRILHLLKKRMKTVTAARYVPDFPILNPRENRVKMRLLLGTRSAHGVEVFREAQRKVERTQIEMRHRIRREEGGFATLFSDEEIAMFEQGRAGIGCPQFQREAREHVLSHLSESKSLRFQEIAVDAMEAVPIRMTQLKDLLLEMRSQGRVAFALPERKRKPLGSTRINLAETPPALSAD